MKLGRYEIKGSLGSGGMGSILLGYDPNLGRSVAIKTLRIEGDVSVVPLLKERFRREARNAAQLSHPNIVIIHDFEADREPVYIVMELVEGVNLRQLVQKEKRLALSERLRILSQIASALDYAHSRAVIHRDVKPENVMIRSDGVVKLTDFGIAKSLEGGLAASSNTLTEAGMMAGTPHYMPPEAITGLPWGPKGDQFSFAVLAYELLLGRKPFQGNTLYVLFDQIRNHPLPSLRSVSKLFPERAYAVLSKATAKLPEQRFRSCLEFVQELEAALEGYGDAESLLESAEEELNLWSRVKGTNDAKAIQEFLERFPESQFSWEAQQRLLELQLEEASWESVRKEASVATLQAFLQRFPNGIYAETAQRRLEWLEAEFGVWEQVRFTTDPQRLENFLQQFPGGPHESAARERLAELAAEAAAWRLATAQDQIPAYRLYLRQYPAGLHAAQAQQRLESLEAEQRSWQRIQDSDDIIALEKFLAEFPQGQYAWKAKTRLEELRAENEAWRLASESEQEEALESYLARYPAGAHALKARALLGKLRNEAAAWERTRVSYRAEEVELFLLQNPQSRFRAAAQQRLEELRAEAQLWEQIVTAPSSLALSSFLERFPQGPHAAQASEMLQEFERERRAWESLPVEDDAPGTLAQLRNFLLHFPKGPHAAEARQRLERIESLAQQADDQAWERTDKLDQAALQAYLTQFPNARHRPQAESQLATLERERTSWQKLERQPSIEALQKFLRDFPSGRYAGQARLLLAQVLEETETWRQLLQSQPDEKQVVEFRRKYPEGRFDREAEKLLSQLVQERAAWEEIPTIQGPLQRQGLKAFLKAYPNGRFASEAARRLELLAAAEQAEWKAIGSGEQAEPALRAFLEKFGDGPLAQPARQRLNEIQRDRQLWLEACSQNTVLAYENYLRQSPSGNYAGQAQAAIEELQRLAEREAWQQAQAQKDRAAFQMYLARFPQGLHAAEAREAIEALEREADEQAWRQAQAESTLVSLQRYLEQYPRGIHFDEALNAIEAIRRASEQKAWEAVANSWDVHQIERYLSDYPLGLHRAEAKQRLEVVAKEARTYQSAIEAGEPEALRLYLAEFFYAPRAAQAGSLLASWQAEEENWNRLSLSDDPALLEAFATRASSKFGKLALARAAQLRQEESAWRQVCQSMNLAQCRAFVSRYPHSKHAAEAQVLLQALEARKRALFRRLRAIAAAGCVVGAVSWFMLREQRPGPSDRQASRASPTIQQPAGQARQPARTPEKHLQAAARETREWLNLDLRNRDALKSFLAAHPDGAYAAAARKRLTYLEAEDRVWQQLRSATDPSALKKFLAAYPDGVFHELARQLLARLEGEEKTWLEASRKREVANLEAYLQTFPAGRYAPEARQMLNELKQAAEAAWQQTLASKDPAAMERYLREHPKSPHAAEARIRLNEWNALREWERIKVQPTLESLEAFRDRYPGSPFEGEATKLLEDLRAVEAWAKIKDSIQASDLEEYLRSFPNSRPRKLAEERLRMIQDWNTARARNSAEEIRRFLDRYQASPFEPEAQNLLREMARLDELKKKKEAGDSKKEPADGAKAGATRVGRDGLIYVRLPGGSFQMGCVTGDAKCDKRLESPRAVTVNPFHIGKHEVTVEAYKKYASETGAKMPEPPVFDKSWSNSRSPVVNVTASDAQSYCAWANPNGRLPTEAEWEFAARGGNYEAIFIGGSQASARISYFDFKPAPQAVAMLEPNAFGLFDMTGNVSEITYAGNSPGSGIVLRGGNFAQGRDQMRISYKFPADGRKGYNGTGFRCIF